MSGEYVEFENVLIATVVKLVSEANWSELAGPVYDAYISEARARADASTEISLIGRGDGIVAQTFAHLSVDEVVESKEFNLSGLVKEQLNEGYIDQADVKTLIDALEALIA